MTNPADSNGGFPVQAARDLLGVARCLRLATEDPGQVLDLGRVERELVDALGLAERQPEKAWELAERAAEELGTLVGPTDSALGMIGEARARVRTSKADAEMRLEAELATRRRELATK
jgi:hypothetical protein